MGGLFHFILPIVKFIHYPFNLISLIPFAFGINSSIWGHFTYKKLNTTIEPYEKSTLLITDGLYKYTRNPIYLGMLAILFGFSLFLGTIGVFIAPVGFFITINTIFIPYEEKDLEETFGKSYLGYKHRIKRWL